MTNLFSFEYQEKPLFNADGTKSNFRQVFGVNGVNMNCPKSTYHIVKTADVNRLGQAFIDKGYEVSSFHHRNGEVIGLNINMGERPTVVGDTQYSLILTIPNNNGGKGYLAIQELRLVCGNGATSTKTMYKDNVIKIPHTIDYNYSLILMEQSISSFASLLEQVEIRDVEFNKKAMTDVEIRFQLNKWFFEQEFPESQKTIEVNGKKEKLTFDKFRELLAVNPTEIKCIARYEELLDAYKKEQEYNAQLNLNLSMYTVYASVTNYLSRRVEKSNSTASNEVQVARASDKLVFFDQF